MALAAMISSADPSRPASAATGSAANAGATHHQVIVHRTIVHHVYTYEPAPAVDYYSGPYYGYYGPTYAPAPPLATVPAAACVALSLIGGC